jgi:hypothetical protein
LTTHKENQNDNLHFHRNNDLKATIKVTPDGDGLDCVEVSCDDEQMYGFKRFTMSKELATALANALLKQVASDIVEN